MEHWQLQVDVPKVTHAVNQRLTTGFTLYILLTGSCNESAEVYMPLSNDREGILTQSVVEYTKRCRLSIFAHTLTLTAVIEAAVDTLDVTLTTDDMRIRNTKAEMADAVAGIRATKLLLLHHEPRFAHTCCRSRQLIRRQPCPPSSSSHSSLPSLTSSLASPMHHVVPNCHLVATCLTQQMTEEIMNFCLSSKKRNDLSVMSPKISSASKVKLKAT